MEIFCCCKRFKNYIVDKWKMLTDIEYRIDKKMKEEKRYVGVYDIF